MQKTEDISADQSRCFFIIFVNSLLLAILLLLKSMAAQATTVQVIDVPHDGYCFFHAISHCLGNPGLTPPDAVSLYGQMQQFLLDNQNNQMLDAALHTYPVAGSLQELADQLNTFPSLDNVDSWAGFPEAVIMSVMLHQPILVLHLDQNQAISSNSFLVDEYDIYPLGTLEGGHHDVPGIQLILSGREWSAIQLDDLTGQWQGQLYNYVQQLSMLFSGHPLLTEQAATGVRVEPVPDLLSGHSSVDNLLTGNAAPVEFGLTLGLSNSNPQGFNRLEFSGQWSEWMIRYARAKMLMMQAGWNMEEATDWPDQEVRSFGETINSYCQLLKSRFARWCLQCSLSSYLQTAGINVGGLVNALIPGEELWAMLITLRPSILKHNHAAGAHNLAQAINSFFCTTQSETPTETRGWDTVPGPIQLPFIENRPGKRLVTFNRLDPVHHILFALNLSARCYKIARLCLGLSRMGEELGPTGDIVKKLGEKRFLQWIADLEARYKKQMWHCQAAIHGFVRTYFSEIWQLGSYQVLKLQDGDCALFYSDDYHPRSGWIDLVPKEHQPEFK